VKRVVEEDLVEGTVEYVTDIAKILDYDIMSMPAIVIDGKVVLNGQVPTADKVRELLEGEKKK
jgi:predicted thioredoxin/glutaredoxin